MTERRDKFYSCMLLDPCTIQVFFPLRAGSGCTSKLPPPRKIKCQLQRSSRCEYMVGMVQRATCPPLTLFKWSLWTTLITRVTPVGVVQCHKLGCERLVTGVVLLSKRGIVFVCFRRMVEWRTGCPFLFFLFLLPFVPPPRKIVNNESL